MNAVLLVVIGDAVVADAMHTPQKNGPALVLEVSNLTVNEWRTTPNVRHPQTQVSNFRHGKDALANWPNIRRFVARGGEKFTAVRRWALISGIAFPEWRCPKSGVAAHGRAPFSAGNTDRDRADFQSFGGNPLVTVSVRRRRYELVDEKNAIPQPSPIPVPRPSPPTHTPTA